MGMYKGLLIMVLVLVIGTQCKSVSNTKKPIYSAHVDNTQSETRSGDNISKLSIKHIDLYPSRHKQDGNVSIRKKKSLRSYGQDSINSLGLLSSKSLGTNSYKNLALKPFKNIKRQPSRNVIKKRYLNTDLDMDLDNSLYELQSFSNTYSRLHMDDGLQIKVDKTSKEKKVGVKVEKGKEGVNVQLTASKGEKGKDDVNVKLTASKGEKGKDDVNVKLTASKEDQAHQGKTDSKESHKIQLHIMPHKPQGTQPTSQIHVQNDQGQSNVQDSQQDELSGVKVQSGPGANSIQISVEHGHPAASSHNVKISLEHSQPSSVDNQDSDDQPIASIIENKKSSLEVLSDMMPSPELLQKRIDEINGVSSTDQSNQKHKADIVVSVQHKPNAKNHRPGSLDIIQAEDKKNEELTKMIEELSERAIEKLERTNKAIENILMTVETDDDHTTDDDSDSDSVEITAGGSDPISVTIQKDKEKTELQNEAVARILLGNDEDSESGDKTVVSVKGFGEDELLDVNAAVKENENLQLQTELLADSLTDLELGINPDLTRNVRHEHKMTAKILRALEKETNKLKENEMEEKENHHNKVVHHTIRISTNT